MFKLISWLLFLPFTTIVIIFAISNRDSIAVDFWPLPFKQDIPLYLLSLGTLAFGFLFGSVLTWLSVAKWRVIAASRKRDTAFAEAQIEHLNAKLKKQEEQLKPTQEILPMMPEK